MLLKTFNTIRESNIDISNINLSDQYCGLFRCPLEKAYDLLPDLNQLFTDAMMMLAQEGHDYTEWEMDLKIHMLMKDQYPCIPNWHCDNVPRVRGKTRYDLIDDSVSPMYLLLSDSPTTEFLSEHVIIGEPPKGLTHGSLKGIIDKYKLPTVKAPAMTWISMNQRTPHRGTVAKENGWRVFVRLTHNSITPIRPVTDYIRRHCQVYLNPNTFEW